MHADDNGLRNHGKNVDYGLDTKPSPNLIILTFPIIFTTNEVYYVSEGKNFVFRFLQREMIC